MKAISAIFIKQLKDTLKTPSSLIMLLLWPGVALMMTLLLSDVQGIDPLMFVAMMSAMFAGMGMIQVVADTISEDIENKSLKFLQLAGVKSYQYMIGVGSFYLIAGTVISVLFGLVARFEGLAFVNFLVIMVLATATSIIIGAIMGIGAKNRQAASSMAMPVGVVIGFLPMGATFNDTMARIINFLFSQQINVVLENVNGPILIPALIILANLVVASVVFMIIFKMKLTTTQPQLFTKSQSRAK